MLPPTSTSSTQTTARALPTENAEDAHLGEPTKQAVTSLPCGHTLDKNDEIHCLACRKLGLHDSKVIEKYTPNYDVRPAFLQDKNNSKKGECELFLKDLVKKDAMQSIHTDKKTQAYAGSSFKRFDPRLLSKIRIDSLVLGDLNLEKVSDNQEEELFDQESKEPKGKEKVDDKDSEELLEKVNQVRQFGAEKLQQVYPSSSPLSPLAPQTFISASSLPTPLANLPTGPAYIQALSPQSTIDISMPSLYKEILQIHFPEENGDFTEQASILDKIYKIKPDCSVEEKVVHIFSKLFTLAANLAPVELEKTPKKSRAFTHSNYFSYLLNINRLLLWHKLPGGTEYLNQPKIKALSLKEKGELLSQWIEVHAKTITHLDLNFSSLTMLPPELEKFSQLQELCIGGNQLTILPACIGRLSKLKKLVASNNHLVALPLTIGQLAELQQLYLGHNQIHTLPAAIGQLSQLQSLSLENNKLAVLPPELFQLSQLHELSLDRNRLTVLPKEIGQLPRLQQLGLNDNYLTALPTEIDQLFELRELGVNNNHLASLPTAIGQLSNLEWLTLVNNNLTAIPPAIGQLAGLQMVDLSRNQLTTLPTQLGQLSQLQELYLSHNQLTMIPPAIGQLTALRILNLDHNQLNTLPIEVGQLFKLKDLGLGHNRLNIIPKIVGQLSELQELDLSYNQLTAIPTTIGQLTELQTLSLNHNQLASIPTDIGELLLLNVLDLSDNELNALPAALAQLSQLQSLHLSNNQLTSIPKAIGQLPCLQHLDLRRNQLAVLPEKLKLPALQTIDLSHNQLATIPASFKQFLQLQQLSFNSQSIITPPPQVPNLKNLILEGNPVYENFMKY
ncbi:leucine-rich repeat domain-containing protein [Neochlamydia sp. AcF95]|uniref:leucine-rich repeat domain-containing protein n=1 Tax=Neochlamydia sp. AcF95 TaxID=2795734 RepID=UPI001BC92176|nr:leucine-rich repeat domain-containing protein [Neochlamydia sp. AcF95]MBS4171258.1 Uncharacterized protein [Neochlamydia sp. AcF95]